ncbi:unnamed protein product [Polarella glacialis]|uniref:Uncharacterized protein n=1 Tax=Polarella glacialis TaxID=89957 RepID=A0A813KHC0_POLGL|nr:unnamed protein product [Polarella glacialis]
MARRAKTCLCCSTRLMRQMLFVSAFVASGLGIFFSLRETSARSAENVIPRSGDLAASAPDQRLLLLLEEEDDGEQERPSELLPQQQVQEQQALPSAGAESGQADTTTLPHQSQRPENSKLAGQTGRNPSRVVVVIPFRDREPHLVKFREYWRWFANISRQHVDVVWDIFVIEQFDNLLFSRGWLFNVGFAAAMKQGIKAKCYVIQDIDYLPEKGVDYSDCPQPTQLSSEIDRYKWSVPYPNSAGGIVAMSSSDWRSINGFSNQYLGWGGEDDELHHRLRLAKLLTGPHIRRPSKGHGRFSGKFMHSMNHTKRIGDNQAYARNVALLRQIETGSGRWKTDGLSDLKFHVVENIADASDSDVHGITYHLMKVRRGVKEHDVSKALLAIPSRELCGAASAEWTWVELGQPVPWDLAELRRRAAKAAGCDAEASKLRTFIVADLEWNLAKLSSDQNPRGVHSFLRSVRAPQSSALIVADLRTEAEVELSFLRRGSVWAPPSTFSVCSLHTGKEPQYHFFKKRSCAGGVWKEVPKAVFTAYTKPVQSNDALKLCYASSKKHEAQRIRKGSGCEGDWGGLKWVKERNLYVAPPAEQGAPNRKDALCVGSRAKDGPSGSKILKSEDCSSNGWSHDFVFGEFVTHRLSSKAKLICFATLPDGRARISDLASRCRANKAKLLGQFAVWTGEVASLDSFTLCSRLRSPHEDKDDRESMLCSSPGCCPEAWRQDLRFVLLRAAQAPETATALSQRVRGRSWLCFSPMSGGGFSIRAGSSCSDGSNKNNKNNKNNNNNNNNNNNMLALEVPSVADLATGILPAGEETLGVLTLLQEDSSCQSFICPEVLDLLYGKHRAAVEK